jgi:hypothetical protein
MPGTNSAEANSNNLNGAQEKLGEFIRNGQKYASLEAIDTPTFNAIIDNTLVVVQSVFNLPPDIQRQIKDRVKFTDDAGIIALERNSGFDIDAKRAQNTLGKTYKDKNGLMQIVLNKKAPAYQNSVLNNPMNRERYPSMPKSPVEQMIRVLTHELFHFVAGSNEINPPVQLTAISGSLYTINNNLGFALGGIRERDKTRASVFGNVDEVAVEIFAQEVFELIPGIHLPNELPDQETIRKWLKNSFFIPLGYDTAQKLYALHNERDAGIKLMDTIATKRGQSGNRNEGFKIMTIVSNNLAQEDLTVQQKIDKITQEMAR